MLIVTSHRHSERYLDPPMKDVSFNIIDGREAPVFYIVGNMVESVDAPHV